jgi:formylglycine-generating enzyme required for sulfatase activity
MSRFPFVLLVVAILVAACAANSHAGLITIDTVPVGNPGNAGELTGTGAGGFGLTATVGAVSYDYRIGTYEVTNDQYVEFLNNKAVSDPLGLYNANMNSNPRGGITQNGVSGGYSYMSKPNMGDKPVNYVSWYDTIRFANWLHNGQGTGDTETGAYTLLGGTPAPSNGASIIRNPGATWFLTNENEWYKAAYHQPAAQGGDSDDYWLYPTASNTIPTIAAANPMGVILNPGSNVANYDLGADWNSLNGNVTTVGSAGLSSAGFYGTFDQGGNLWEWNEFSFGSGVRGARGGGWGIPELGTSGQDLAAYTRGSVGNSVGGSSYEANDTGFRVATIPEPGTLSLLLFGGLTLLRRRRA